MFTEFKKFLFRGNVVDLAVGVIIGAAFGTVVSALVSDLLTPLIAAVTKIPDFSNFAFTINGSKFMIGHFINALISFILVAVAIFFFVIKPINMMMPHKNEEPAKPAVKNCNECLSEIPVEAKRCSHCCQKVS